MEEIKVGEYIRFNDGIIAKVKKIKKAYQDNEYYIHYSLDENNIRNYSGITTERSNVKNVIKKHSFNIEDLVQKGDFVNGYEVDDFDGYDEEGNYFENDLGIPIYDDANMDCIVEYRPIRLMKIKSIVTKEQFKAMEYEVK